MSDKTSGTPAGEGGAAIAATGTPPQEGANANQPETVEQLRERISKLEQEKAQHLAEKNNRTREQEEAEALRRERDELQRRLANPPNTGPPQSPLDQAIAIGQEAIRDVLAEAQRYGGLDARGIPVDPALKAAYVSAAASVANFTERKQQAEGQSRVAAARPAFEAMPENIREMAWNAWINGYVADPQTARAYAEGQLAVKAAQDKNSADDARRKADDEARERMAGKPSTSTASLPPPDGSNVVPLSEYNRRVASCDRKLMAEVEAGRKILDYSK